MHSRLERWIGTALLAGACAAVAAPGHADDIAKYFDVADGGGLTNEATHTNWSRKWDRIVQAGLFGSTNARSLVFYNRLDGLLKVIQFDDAGALNTLAAYNVSTGWDQIVRGQFGHNLATDLVFYNRATGLLRIYEIGYTDGALLLLFEQNVGTSWDVLVAGHWSEGTFTDLLGYNRTEGKGRVWKANNVTHQLDVVKNYSLQKSWDQIVPGKFGANNTTDLLFYNQDGGIAKFVDVDSSHNMTELVEKTDWPMTENLIVVPGRFGGGSKTDLLLYDQNQGTGTFMVDGPDGSLGVGSVQNWQKKWTQIAAVDQTGSVRSDLLVYSNLHTVKIKAVRVANDDGSDGTAITAAQVTTWVETARPVFRPAGIDLSYDGTLTTIHDTGINHYHCDGDPESLKDHADQTAESISDDSVVVFFRTDRNAAGTPTGGGCGSSGRRYVIMPGFNNTGTTYWRRDGLRTDMFGNVVSGGSSNNIKLFPHELGHYFGLPHTYFAGVPASLAAMDGDASSHAIFDTPPDPSGVKYDTDADGVADTRFWDYWGYNRCDDTPDGQVPFTAGNGVTYLINPDRHNAMNNGINCDLFYRLTPNQIARAREVLFTIRPYLLP